VRVPTVEGRRRPLGLRGWLIGGAILIVFLLLSLRGFARFYTDYLWFKDVGFDNAWRSLLSAKIVPALIFGAVFFVVMLANLIIADRMAPRYRGNGPEDEIIERYRSYVAPYAGRVRFAVSLFFAIVMASGVSAQWQSWILFSNSTSFGIKDPQFNKDISFYVFRLPFLQFAAAWTFAALLVILIVAAVFHYLNGGIRLQSPFQRVTPQVKAHLSVLLALMALTKTAQYYLDQFALTMSNRGAVQGATYTDVNAQLPALKLLMVISIAAAVLFIINIWRRGWMFPLIAVGLWGFISIVVGTVVPVTVQRFTVQPNELAREQPYIERNITATRAAFGLDKIQSKAYPVGDKLTLDAKKQNQETLDNVRLYDPDPAKTAFQVKEARFPFYEINDVDVDRYTIGAEERKPALVSVRELNQGNLPNNSWTNRHLVYTHGYAAVAAAADAVNRDEPKFVLNNIPPTGEPDLNIDPKYTGIYFGEDLTGYAVVGSKVAEQEAAGSDETADTKYEGEGGVPISSWLRKTALALRFGDWNLWVSGQVTSDSKALYIRDVAERVNTIAPFLKLDRDPYPVVSEGRVVWMIDAYTTSNNYPYSQSIHPRDVEGSGLDTDFNYVRNSVKVTVDAYDGTVHFYVVDDKDPIINTYRKAFPHMFEDSEKMPEALQEHWRYPEDIFKAQTEQYSQYHVTDPVQYFQQQDLWDITPSPDASGTPAPAAAAQQVNQGNDGGRSTTLAATDNPIPPIYLAMQLPDEDGQEFVLQRSFTPRSKGGILSAFMVARSDPENYGKLVVYDSGESSSAPSPAQAATSIEADQFIAQQFTLLDQRSSNVERGEVQLIPIGDTIVYIRPIWITGGTGSTFPRYRFIAASLGEQAKLGNSVDDAVNALITGGQTQYQKDYTAGRTTPSDIISGNGSETTTTTLPSTTPGTQPSADASVQELLASAAAEFSAADTALRNGDLAEYAKRVNAAKADVAAAEAKLRSTASSTTTSTAAPSSTP
jgi:uncharacterized membrane protein (UPF0182 family)